jgi:hypothetical protein
MSMDKELADIRRRAGLKETQEIIPPNRSDDEQARLDAEEDMYFDRQIAIEKVYKQKYAGLYKRAGLADEVEALDVDIDQQTGRVEIEVKLYDIEVSVGVLAKLSEVGAINLESKVKAYGSNITIGTVEQLSPQDLQQFKRPQR